MVSWTSINRSINQSINRSINQSINAPLSGDRYAPLRRVYEEVSRLQQQRQRLQGRQAAPPARDLLLDVPALGGARGQQQSSGRDSLLGRLLTLAGARREPAGFDSQVSQLLMDYPGKRGGFIGESGR